MHDGKVYRLARIVDEDGQGVRIFVNRGSQIELVSATRGAKVTAWGGYGPRTPDGRRGPKLGGQFSGPLVDVAEVERLESCGCGNPLKAFRPPAWT